MAIIKITEPEKGMTSKKPTYENLPEGGYEVYVDRASDVTEFEGIEKTSLMFRVRDDVDTEHPRRTVFTNISTAPNMGWKLSNIALAAGVPAGTLMRCYFYARNSCVSSVMLKPDSSAVKKGVPLILPPPSPEEGAPRTAGLHAQDR